MSNRISIVGLGVCIGLLVASVGLCDEPLVKIESGKLLVDFDRDGVYTPYFIKGVGYSPVPIGRPGLQWGETNIYDDDEILNRDFQYLYDMHANTIRLWKADNTNNENNEFPNYMTPHMLDVAESYGLRVIPGFWIEFGGYWTCGTSGREFVWDESFFDLTNRRIWPLVKDDIVSRWQNFVDEFKDDPDILFWAIGNENNCQLGEDEDLVMAFYALIDEMADYAHTHDTLQRPVSFVNGDIVVNVERDGQTVNAFSDIVHTTAAAVDIWGVNIYKGLSFGDFFDQFESIKEGSDKVLWVSEFGVDAWNSDIDDAEGGFEDEETQAAWLSALWNEIVDAKDQGVIGATVMAYCDEWWKPDQWMCLNDGWEEWWQPYWNFLGGSDCGVFNDSHDLYGYGPTDSNCDGEIIEGDDWIPPAQDEFFNEEWWGIMRTFPALDEGSYDQMEPRAAYYTLTEEFAKGVYNQKPEVVSVVDQSVRALEALNVSFQATDPDDDALSLSITMDNGQDIATIGASFVDHGDGTGELIWTPALEYSGQTLGFVVIAQDEEPLSDSKTFSVSVLAPLPHITGVSVSSGKPGDILEITGEHFGVYASHASYNAVVDFDLDDDVDYADMQYFFASGYLQFVREGYVDDKRTDVNYDGEVTINDFFEFVRSYGKQGGESYVTFSNGIRAKVQSWTDTHITCVVPYSDANSQVQVTTVSGASDPIAFSVVSEEISVQIDSLSSTTVSVGDDVVIYGQHFGSFDGSFKYDMAYDFDSDADVDAQDLSRFCAAWGLQIGDTGFLPSADSDGNGKIDVNDFFVFVRHYNSQRGNYYVVFSDNRWARIVAWSDTEIRCEVPLGAVTGDVSVVAKDGGSNAISVVVVP